MNSSQHDARLEAAVRAWSVGKRPQRARPACVHLGTVAGDAIEIEHDPNADAGLRADLVERALDQLVGLDRADVWITRDGALSPGDLDFAWLSAAQHAFGRYARPLSSFYVITSEGYFDLIGDRVARLEQD